MPAARMPLAICIRTMIALLSASGDPDDRLAAGAPVGGECSGRFRECPYGPDDRLQPSVPESLGEVRQPGAVGFDDEEDGPAVLRLDPGWLGDGDMGAAGGEAGGCLPKLGDGTGHRVVWN